MSESHYADGGYQSAGEDVDGIEDFVADADVADSEAVGVDDVLGADGDGLDDNVLVLEEIDNELVLPVWEATGEPRVDAALDLLVTLDDDVHRHAAVFDEVHQQLRAALSDIDASTT